MDSTIIIMVLIARDMGALDLIPEDQFHAQYKKEIVKEADSNPHFLLIKRLEFELSHRIAYANVRKWLLSEFLGWRTH